MCFRKSNALKHPYVLLPKDGTEPENCGNGIRCMTKYVQVLEKSGKKSFKILTGGGTFI